LSSGYDVVTGNFASVENRGIELSLGGDIIRSKDLRWNVSTNITFNRNKLLRLADDSTKEATINNFNILPCRQPIGTFQNLCVRWHYANGETVIPGQPVNNPRPGTVKVKDVSGPAWKTGWSDHRIGPGDNRRCQS
jgi:hypothetical protein